VLRRLFLAALLTLAALGVAAPDARAQKHAPSAHATAPAASAAPVGSGRGVSAPASGHAEAPGRAETAGAPVRIHDRRVFVVVAARAGRTAEQRAAAASQALERSLDEAEPGEVRVDEQGDVAVVFAGAIPVIQLGPEDVAAAGDASLAVHAAGVAGRTRDALRAERQRSAIAQTVFSFSLVVFSGLVAFLLLRKLEELIEKARGWMESHPDRLPALHIRGIEVVRPAAVRGGVDVAITIAKRLAQIGVVYAWVLIALSLFESTRGYTERLTGFVLRPVSEMVGRVVSALPLVVIAVVTALVVGGAIRFVRLFFGSVARGETTLGWLPRDLAPATSILLRIGMVVVTLVVAAPLITGNDEGPLSRAGAVALAALGVASTPLLSTAAAGIAVMFGGRLRVGEHAVVGGRAGKVRSTTLLEVVLEDEDGCNVHVPHLLSLWHPTRILGPAPPIHVEIAVDPAADLPRAVAAFEEAAATVGTRARVELASLGADGARFRISVQPVTLAGGAGTPRVASDARSRLCVAIAAALRERGIALGRGSA
jgi:small-conductance mechanosensitive channel